MSSAFPSYWQQAWDEAQPRLRAWQQSLSSTSSHLSGRIPRVGQLDAESLDTELLQLLREPLTKALTIVDPTLRVKLEPELVLIIQLSLYRFSLWDTGATYGAKLQDLRYYVSRSVGRMRAPSGLPARTLAAHAALTVILPYLFSRIRTHALSHAWPDTPSVDPRRKAWNILTKLESLHASATLFSFVVFLWDGRYRTLADRLLSMRLLPSRRVTSRAVSYEFMNRQMVWHAFTEFLLLVLPVFRGRTFRRVRKQVVARVRNIRLPFTDAKASSSRGPNSALSTRGRLYSLPENQCAICAEESSFSIGTLSSDAFSLAQQSTATADDESDPTQLNLPKYPITTPYRTSCGHLYCYYCFSDRLIRAVDDGDDGWECLRCAEIVRDCSRVTAIADDTEDSMSLSTGTEDETDGPAFESDMSFDSESESIS